MNKAYYIVALLVVGVFHGIGAHNNPVQVIRYTVTLCKNDSTTPEVWEKMIERARCIEQAEAGKRMKKISKTLQTHRGIVEQHNIITDVQVMFGDGTCSCGNKQACRCAERYRGICPCPKVTDMMACRAMSKNCCK